MLCAATIGMSYAFAKYREMALAQLWHKNLHNYQHEPIKIPSNHGDFILFSGNSNPELSEEVAKYLGVKLGKLSI